MVKKKIILLFCRFFYLFGCLFYEKKYLKGRHFLSSTNGVKFMMRSIWERNILRLANPLPFPAAAGCRILNPERIHFDVDDLNNFQMTGCYYQNFSADIWIGKGTYIASNVGLITANHDLSDIDKHAEGKDIVLGEKCWIGMNSVILPGVVLGDYVVVGAGSVVTKSFSEGYCVIAGNPARLIRKLNYEEVCNSH